jgi:hypothetical protein
MVYSFVGAMNDSNPGQAAPRQEARFLDFFFQKLSAGETGHEPWRMVSGPADFAHSIEIGVGPSMRGEEPRYHQPDTTDRERRE